MDNLAVNKGVLVTKLSQYLHHEITLAELVDWAENVMQEGNFPEQEHDVLRAIVGRLGVADVREFGLTWDELEEFLARIGFRARIDVVAQK
ncbi:MAG: hypothetical protein HY706_14440 [Candidatus Hydrogenedentes bacterium]|nr:hypothetical protein [Candidatus Hydrogenedentota bacterium]